MSKASVIFASPVFDYGVNGPATYARYLWKGFRADKDLDFHLVTHSSSLNHPRIHTCGSKHRSGFGRGYPMLCDQVKNVAERLQSPIVHANNAFGFSRLLFSGFQLIGQLNDYETLEVGNRLFRTGNPSGVKRSLTLLWRRFKEERFAASADIILCNSEFVRRLALRKISSLSSDRLITIHKGVDSGFFTPPKSGEGAGRARGEGFGLIFIGANWRTKGLPVLFEAMARLPKTVFLKVLGPSEGECRQSIEQ